MASSCVLSDDGPSNHAVLVAAVTAPLIFGALAVVRSRPSGLLRALAQGLFILATLGVAVLTIGMFEGLYNHVLKNLLYFGGLPSALMTRLFPRHHPAARLSE